jgi:hypothetical protein
MKHFGNNSCQALCLFILLTEREATETAEMLDTLCFLHRIEIVYGK